MKKITGAYAPRIFQDLRVSCVRDVRAQAISIGGVILIAICVILTVVALLMLESMTITSAQRGIIGLLAFGSWLYAIDSLSERLTLVNKEVHFRSFFSRHRAIPLIELEAMILVQQGFNLEQGMQSIEFRRHGFEPDHITLGPCWRRHRLEDFLHSVELALNDPHLLEEVR
ncbi:hypothetical protein IT408_00190 [Candidatus Uhrbacteria bacterium]|nr:hypothetical protein [Candidatus Uhrbacteria bacterium]